MLSLTARLACSTTVATVSPGKIRVCSWRDDTSASEDDHASAGQNVGFDRDRAFYPT
jgi:hypothetical protein